MPSLPVVPNVIKVRQRWTRGTDTDVLTHHYLQYAGGPPSTANIVAMATSYQGLVVTNFKASATADITIEECFMEDLSSSSGAVGSGGTPTVGTNPNVPLGGAAAVNIQSIILRRYRGGKPRTEWPLGSADDLTTAQAWKGSFVSGMATLHSAFASDVLAITEGTTTIENFVNVSYFSGFTVVTNPVTGRSRNVPKLRVGGPVVDVVTGFVVHTALGTIRRRQ